MKLSRFFLGFTLCVGVLAIAWLVNGHSFAWAFNFAGFAYFASGFAYLSAHSGDRVRFPGVESVGFATAYGLCVIATVLAGIDLQLWKYIVFPAILSAVCLVGVFIGLRRQRVNRP